MCKIATRNAGMKHNDIARLLNLSQSTVGIPLKEHRESGSIRKAFSKFYHRHSEFIVKYNIGLKLFCNKAYQNLYFMLI